MTGARLEILSKGNQDIYLTGNPSMTYFKTVYKRHTNFALETKNVSFNYFTNLQYTTVTTSTIKLEKLGDLITNIFLVFNLPDILSESDRKVSWIKYIGLNILNKVSISIGGNLIDEQYSEWMFIWNELTLSKDKKELYYRLIGHEKELYEPSEAYNRNSFYPDCAFEKTKSVAWFNEDTENVEYKNISVNHAYNKPPSIPSRQIYVPLNFWFTSDYGLALPLIALQYHEISMTFEFKSISELYTLLVSLEDIKRYGISQSSDKDIDKIYLNKYNIVGILTEEQRIKPDISNQAHHIKNFLTDSLISPIRKSKNDWELKPHLEITYAYLDDEEKKIFMTKKHDYLIHQVKKIEKIGLFGNLSIKLNFSNPVKELIWVCYRNDRKNYNDFNNYTNWENQKKPKWQRTFSKENKIFIDFQESTYWNSTLGGNNIRMGRDPLLGYLYIKKLINKVDSNGNVLTDPITGENQTTYTEIARFDTSYDTLPPEFNTSINNEPINLIENYENNKKNILKSAKLLLNNFDRFSEKHYDYFNKLQPYSHHTSSPPDGILTYSFALKPESIQPSGTCNFTKLTNKQLKIETIIPPINNNGDYEYLFNVNIYALTYNILTISNGMAGLVFI